VADEAVLPLNTAQTNEDRTDPAPDVPVFRWDSDSAKVVEDVDDPLPPQVYEVRSRPRKVIVYAHFVVLHATIIQVR
jgi:hypothetical protein